MERRTRPLIARSRYSGSSEIMREVARLVPILGAKNATKLEKAYLLGDEETRARIMSIIDALKASAFSDDDLRKSVLMEPPPEEECIRGDLNVGTVLYGKRKLYPLMYDKEHLLTHMGIFGSSGYGKTNLVYRMIDTLADQNVPVVIFDFSKRNYRDLIGIPKLKERMKIYTVGREVSPFRFNPLVPPKGVTITQWAKEFSEIFDHSYWLLGGGKHIVLKALGDIYERPAKVPRIKSLRNWMYAYGESKVSARERNWMATAERPVESLNFGDTGKVFETDAGIMPSTFFKSNDITVLELDALSPNDRSFFIEIILQWLRDWLLVEGDREKLTGVIVLEEAHHLINREKSKRLGTESVIDVIFREIRELGVGIIYTDQHPSMISYPALGNTSTQVYMNLGLDSKQSSDIEDASNMLGIDYREDGRYLRKLPVGHGFMLCRRLAFSDPFLAEFGKVELVKGSVSDEDVSLMMKGCVDVVESDDSVREVPQLDEREMKVLHAVYSGAGSSASEIYRALSMSGTSFKDVSLRLVERGVLGMSETKVYRQNSCCYFVTAVGRKVIEERYGKARDVVEDIDVEEVKKILGKRQLSMDGFSGSIYPVVTNDFRQLYGMVSRVEGSDYFVCSSDAVKNSFVQAAAQYACLKNNPFVIFVATVEGLRRGGKFRKIEFLKSEDF